MIDITVLSDEPPSATALLSFDDIDVLIDPCADKLLRFALDDRLQGKRPDLVLLSHSDLAHLGGYVHAFKHLGWDGVPCLATLPVVNMGRMTMHDAVKSVLPEDLAAKDVDDAFDHITSLRYAQAAQLAGRLQGLNITAHNAGHSLGGAIWRIGRGAETVVYADAWNHARDAHLNGAALFTQGQVPDQLARPSVLVTDALNADLEVATRARRSEALFESIMATLASNGQVLMPIDSATRSLELCEMLETHWRSTTPPIPFPIYFLSHTATKAIGYARSMLEWMNDKMINDHGSSGGLFEFRHLKLIVSATQLDALPPGPKVVLASSADLDSGFSQSWLLGEFASNPSNLVILSQRSAYAAQSLAGSLMAQWERETANASDALPQYIGLAMDTTGETRRLVALEGEELRQHNERERERREAELARTAMQERNRNILDASDSESEDEEDGGVAASAIANQRGGAQKDAPLGAAILTVGNTFDVQCTDRQFSGLPSRLKMFPLAEKRRRFDDYGEVLRPDEFRRADQEEAEAEHADDGRRGARDLQGKKRKWNEVANGNAEAAPEEDRTVPSKLVVEQFALSLRCRLRYIDMEGVHDGRSLKNIVESVNPRKLVVSRGSTKERAELRRSCLAVRGFAKDVLLPGQGERIPISLDTDAFELELSDGLFETLTWQQLANEQVAHVSGKIVLRSAPIKSEDDAKEDVKMEDAADGDVKTDVTEQKASLKAASEDKVPLLEALSAEEAARLGSRTTSLYIGNVRLADLRRALQGQGHTAELRGGGVLFCDDAVAVRKLGDGEVLLDGLGSDHFWQIRDAIYGSLANVEL